MRRTFRPTGVLIMLWVLVGLLALAVFVGVKRGSWVLVPFALVPSGLFAAWWARQRLVLDGDRLELRTTRRSRSIRLSQVDRMEVHVRSGRIVDVPRFELHAGLDSLVVDTMMFGPQCHRAVIELLPEPFRQEAKRY